MVPCSETPPGAPFARARPCILVVEDELLIRTMVADELREEGYDAIEACDAGEALTVLQSLVRVDLVFSDVRMPGEVDGLGLMAIVRTSFPALPVILTSGHLEADIALADGACRFLGKPYQFAALLGAVRHALGGAS
jgi:CheY-like chemotaxis protein